MNMNGLNETVMKYYDDVKESAKGLPNDVVTKAIYTYLDAYQLHKQKFGSLRHERKDYANKMEERYTFMRDQTMEYIKNERESM